MDITVHFCGPTVKQLRREWHAAVQRGHRRLIRHISALLEVGAGVPVAEAAERVGVHVSTVYRWLQAFLLRRWDSLRYGSAPGRPSKLTPTQKARLKDLVAAGPLAAGYPTGCWSSLLLQDLIYREFGRLYNAHDVCTLLRNLGFSFQKARFVSDHLDEERRRTWLHEEWPAIVRLARQRGALLLFGDEASFAQWGALSYTWAPRGQQPLVLTCGKRKAYKVFGLIDYLTGRLFYHGQTERFTAQSDCAFLRLVLAQTDRPIMLIQDGAKYHTAAATKEFLAAQGDRLSVYQLPSYSPDYNPKELRPSYDRDSADQPQGSGAYHGGASRPSSRGLHATGGPALPPCRGAAVGDRAAGWEPAVCPGLLVHPADGVPGERERSGGHDHDGWLTSVQPRRHPLESEGAA